MKKFALFVLMLCLAAAALPRTAMADDDWLGYFYEELSPYGEWIYVAGYGDCWRPFDADPAWAPYTDGYWAYTDAGWTWVSYEDFGPITYHYGRWFRVESLGWLWRPDTEWGPAWVSWRSNDDYIGWAPLPPEVVFDTGIGISVWVDRDYDIGPGYYSFCNAYDFGAPVMSGVIFNRSRNVTIINQTVNITNITINRSKKIVYNGGPDYRRVSRHSRHHIATLRLDRRHDDYRREGRRSIERTRRDGDRLVIQAPDSKWIKEQRTSRPKVSRRVERPTVDKGWASVRDQEDRQRIRRKFETETKGVTRTSAPARPVDEKTFETALEADKARRERNSSRSGSDRRDAAIEEQRRERRTEAGPSPDATRPPATSESEAARRARQEAAGREGRTREDATRERQRDASQERSRTSAGQPGREQQDAARQQQQREQRERAREQQESAGRQQQDAARQQQQREQQERAREQQENALRQQQDAARRQREQQERTREQQENARRQQQDAVRQQQQQREQQERARQQQESARRQQDAARQQQQQREQQDRARQQQENARRQQDAARQQQQERARQQQESARRQQDAARQQQDRARQQQERSRQQQDAARQQQQQQQRDSDRQRDGRSTGAGRDNRDRR
ncbi:MAG TPA: DUF6600 domain-containing protein [Chthoniobacteraceae bacterium]|nr:DUF6600 domain-containing protein [Chthoniobacteraceae bacterium]